LKKFSRKNFWSFFEEFFEEFWGSFKERAKWAKQQMGLLGLMGYGGRMGKRLN